MGFGVTSPSLIVTLDVESVTRGSLHTRDITLSDSSSNRARSRKLRPTASYSDETAPDPTPRMTRPCDNWSKVATYFANSTGGYRGSVKTEVPSRMDFVTPARYVRHAKGL